MSGDRVVETAGTLGAELQGPAYAEVATPALAAQSRSPSSGQTTDAGGAPTGDGGKVATPQADQATGAQRGQEGASDGKRKVSMVEQVIHLRGERNAARAEKAALSTENAGLRAELEQLRQQQTALLAQPELKDPGPKPERQGFASEEDFLLALADWSADQRAVEHRQAQQEARQQVVTQQVNDTWAKRLEQSKATLTDYDEVVGKADIQLPNHIYGAIVESEFGPELAYYLAKNPDEVKLLSNLPPYKAVKVLGQLEDMLYEQTQAATGADDGKQGTKEGVKDEKPLTKGGGVPRQVPAVSQAAAPADPLGGGTVAVSDPTKENYDEWRARRTREQISDQRRPR